MIRVVLPHQLQLLAHTGPEVRIEIDGSVTQRSIIDAIETRYPALKGAIRDQVTQRRRPMVRFFACQEDYSHQPPDVALPELVASGQEPFLIVAAIAGG